MSEIIMSYNDSENSNNTSAIRYEPDKYGDVPVPSKYKKGIFTERGLCRGVAAFSTKPPAEALAKELTEQFYYQHIVEVDNKEGCAVVLITNHLFIPLDDSDVTMSVLMERYSDFFNTGYYMPNLKYSNDGEIKVGTNPETNVIYLEEMPIMSVGTMEARLFEGIRRKTNNNVSIKNFNAAICINPTVQKALLLAYPNDISDADNIEVNSNDILYDNCNNTVTIEDIVLRRWDVEIPNTEHMKVINYFWQAVDKNQTPLDLKCLKKTLWSKKERDKKELWTPEEKEKKDAVINTIYNGLTIGKWFIGGLALLSVLVWCVMVTGIK